LRDSHITAKPNIEQTAEEKLPLPWNEISFCNGIRNKNPKVE
jgi:hypothetical protein